MIKVPAVRVFLEDKSYIQEEAASGRSVLLCILSDRGRHNRVVEKHSIAEFIDEFGKPDIERHGQGHLLATKILQYTNRLHVIRPALLDSPIPDHNASLANVIIKANIDQDEESRVVNGKFVFVNRDDAVTNYGEPILSKYVYCNYLGFEEISIGDYIYNSNDPQNHRRRVISKTRLSNIGTDTSNYIYRLELDDFYTGQSVVNTDDSNSLLFVLDGDPTLIDSYNIILTYLDYAVDAFEYTTTFSEISHNYSFTENSNVVVCENSVAYDAVSYEDWIYPVSSTVIDARQVIDKKVTADGEYHLILNDVSSVTSVGHVYKHALVEIYSEKFIKSEKDFNEISEKNLFYIYATGVGSYYNTIYLQAVRNTQLERMYTDERGDPIYKYAFFDLYVYGSNPDGSRTLLEGPWPCSLMNRVNDVPVRDVFTGRELYIVKTINSNSKILQCKEGLNTSSLEKSDKLSELLRLQILSKFAESNVRQTQTRGEEGFYLENGGDGNLYDQWGRLQLTHPEIQSMLSSAYNGTLKSTDGSIGLIQNSLYPTYNFDYVCVGGYSNAVQSSAMELVENRWDCMLLCDSGYNTISAEEDVRIRKEVMNWNSMNVMIYSQYASISDPYSGKIVSVTPVYNAIECHLRVDNNQFLGRPVAGIGSASVNGSIGLAYKPTEYELETLLDNEINPVINEEDGTYIISQFTTYKPYSILKRGHAAKFIHFIRKQIRKLLKDLLQRSPTPYWIGVAESRVDSFLKTYANSDSSKYILTSYDIDVNFSEERSEIDVILNIKIIRAIENINVYINVS